MSRKAIVYLLFMAILMGIVYAVPQGPHVFYGNLTVEGSQAAVGTTLKAKIGGVVRGEIATTQIGSYGGSSAASPKLAVTGCTSGDSCYGQTSISFVIIKPGATTELTCDESATFNPDDITNLNINCGAAPTVTTAAAGGGGGGAGGGAGAGAVEETLTLVTNAGVIESVKKSLPSGWKKVKLYTVGEPSSKSMPTNAGTIDNALTYAKDVGAITVLQSLKADIESGKLKAVPVTSTLDVYKILNEDTGEWIYRSKITLTATAPDKMKNVIIIEIIPSSIAKSLDELIFTGDQPKILQSEGAIILQWTIPLMDKGESKQISYFVAKRLISINTQTLAAGTVVEEAPLAPVEEIKPPEVMKKPIPWVGIIIVVAIVVVGLGIYFAVSKKKKK